MKRVMPYFVGIVFGAAVALIVAVPLIFNRAARQSEIEMARKLLVLCEMGTAAYGAFLESSTNLTQQTVRKLALSSIEAHKKTYEDIIAEDLMPMPIQSVKRYREACSLLERHRSKQQPPSGDQQKEPPEILREDDE